MMLPPSHETSIRSVERAPLSVPARILVGLLAAGSISVAASSRLLSPDPRGFGTHEQIVGVPCTFRAFTGIPCPTCGMTTSFAHMARGEIAQALHAQPMGAALFAMLVLGGLLSAFSAVTGVPFWQKLDGRPIWVLVAVLVAGLLAGWLYKIWKTLSV